MRAVGLLLMALLSTALVSGSADATPRGKIDNSTINATGLGWYTVIDANQSAHSSPSSALAT